jgi:RluA family pseudouridine synthase
VETRFVSPEQQGIRLLDFLVQSWPEVDRVCLRRLVGEGQVTVNRQVAHGREKLGPRDEVRVRSPGGTAGLPRRRSGSPRLPAVLVESDFCLVVDKPPGEPTVPDRSGRHPGVHGQLSRLRPHDDLRIAHRLDRETSGCLVLAVGLRGARWLDAAFRAGTVQKEYLALVEGEFGPERLEIRRSLGPDPSRPGRVRVVPNGQRRSRPARTDVEVAERFRGYTLLRVRPRTGRGHQVRVHLQSVGHPIAADETYGARWPVLLSSIKPGYKLRRGMAERPLLTRMFLHAHRVEIPVPDGGRALRAESPLPDDLSIVMQKLRRFASPDRRSPSCN